MAVGWERTVWLKGCRQQGCDRGGGKGKGVKKVCEVACLRRIGNAADDRGWCGCERILG